MFPNRATARSYIVNPEDAVWDDAWRVTEKLILAMHDDVSARPAKFFVVTLSNGIQVNRDAAIREQFMRTFKIEDLFYPDKRIKALGEREGFPVLNLAPLLLDYATRNQTYLHGFTQNLGRGHWNAAGHSVAGELIARQICEETEISERSARAHWPRDLLASYLIWRAP